MARFRYLGEQPRRFVKQYGQTIVIRVPSSQGVIELRPHGGEAFAPGEMVAHDFTDPRSLRHLRADPRFEEIPHG